MDSVGWRTAGCRDRLYRPVDINSGYILNPYTLSGLEGLCINTLLFQMTWVCRYP